MEPAFGLRPGGGGQVTSTKEQWTTFKVRQGAGGVRKMMQRIEAKKANEAAVDEKGMTSSLDTLPRDHPQPHLLTPVGQRIGIEEKHGSAMD